MTETKAVVSVAEMARMVGLSRSRFYQLIGSAFPHPVYDPSTRRPIYVEEMQQVCLEVRRRNCGIDGRPVLFYPRRFSSPALKPKKPKPEPKDLSALVDGLNGLGLTTATGKEIQKVVQEMYPKGTAGLDQAEVLRAVFLHLKRKNSGDNVGR